MSSLDLVFTRRKLWKLGPLTGLVSRCVPGTFDSVGVVVVDPTTGNAKILEANHDGSVSLTPFPTRLRDPDCEEVAIRSLIWPDRKENDSIHFFTTSAILQAGADPNRPRPPWKAAVDARFSPLLRPRQAWPAAPANAPLVSKLDGAVSPSATLVVELYCTIGAMPTQHRATPYVPADFAENDPPLRKGARLSPLVPIRVGNAKILA